MMKLCAKKILQAEPEWYLCLYLLDRSYKAGFLLVYVFSVNSYPVTNCQL